MSRVDFKVEEARAGLRRCYEYTSNWYYWQAKLSKAVKEWRSEKTLTLVK